MNYYTDTEKLALLGCKKAESLSDNRLGLWVGGMAAGAYVGLAILLIFTLGTPLDPSVRPLVMGAGFGLALVLVVFAGAELFTGYVMYTFIAVKRGYLTVSKALIACSFIFAANLAGALLLVALYYVGKGSLSQSETAGFLQQVAAKKMSLSIEVLIARGILCNWLVCLALWMSTRLQNEAAKLLAIAWCLLAFIACGYEHSVANMTVHLLALVGPENSAISFAGMGHNLLWAIPSVASFLWVGCMCCKASNPKLLLNRPLIIRTSLRSH